jgi:hypothetical protein
MLRVWLCFNQEAFKPYLESHYEQGIALMLWYEIRYPIWIRVVFEIDVVTWMRL